MKSQKFNTILKLLIICFTIIVIFFLIFRNQFPNFSDYIKNQIGNWYYNIRMLGVDKDISIQKCGGFVEAGGYANTSYKYYVDIDKKKIYKVNNYYVWGVTMESGEDGSHYSLEKTKKLSKDSINKLIELTKLESDYEKPVENAFREDTYFLIKYKGKEIKLKPSTAEIIVQILNDLNN